VIALQQPQQSRLLRRPVAAHTRQANSKSDACEIEHRRRRFAISYLRFAVLNDLRRVRLDRDSFYNLDGFTVSREQHF
jgi:hypothetical protein